MQTTPHTKKRRSASLPYLRIWIIVSAAPVRDRCSDDLLTTPQPTSSVPSDQHRKRFGSFDIHKTASTAAAAVVFYATRRARANNSHKHDRNKPPKINRAHNRQRFLNSAWGSEVRRSHEAKKRKKRKKKHNTDTSYFLHSFVGIVLLWLKRFTRGVLLPHLHKSDKTDHRV